MNFINVLKKQTNYTETENGGIAHKSTLNAVYDLFALGGAYRSRSDEDCILLFKKAYEQDPVLALRCLFYLRDIRGGQGERRFFRVCYNWLAQNDEEAAFRNLDLIPEYGRWDDLYCLSKTPVAADAYDFMYSQMIKDINSLSENSKEGVSLLAKWLKSENASAIETKQLANETRKAFKLSHKAYRNMLTMLRKRINIVETLMSSNRWDEINFTQIPSKAGLIYKNAFAHNDWTKEKYAEFIQNKDTKVRAAALYPYEIVKQVTNNIEYEGWGRHKLNLDEVARAAINKYWTNQIDYLQGKKCKTMCIVDTSGSMTTPWSSVKPIDVAISLGIYCAERISGEFKNHFISFSSRPQLIEIEGIDFCDRVKRIYEQNLCENTNLTAVFDMLLEMYITHQIEAADMPDQLVVISDMEIDNGSYWRDEWRRRTEMATIRQQWENAGLQMPRLVYWNVAARHNLILDDAQDDSVTFVSGCSPVIFQSILEGKSGIQVMLDKLNSNRYKDIN